MDPIKLRSIDPRAAHGMREAPPADAADVVPPQPPRVDPDNGVIYAASAAMVGEALGHGMLLDARTIESLVSLGNSRSQGIKVRYTHPGMCDDGLGKLCARATNWRASDNGLHALCDLHFLDCAAESPDGDLRNYLIKLASEAPEDFGLSVVITGNLVWQLEDGSEIPFRYDDPEEIGATTDMPLMRPDHLYAADFVDEPAANSLGLFAEALSQGRAGFTQADQAFKQIDTLATTLGWDARDVARFAQRYLTARGLPAALSIPDPEDTPMPEDSQLMDDEHDETQAAATPDSEADLAEHDEKPDDEAEMAEGDGDASTDDDDEAEMAEGDAAKEEDDDDVAASANPASLAQLKEACPDAPADFILAQLEAGADVRTAKTVWASTAALRSENAQLKERLAATEQQQAKLGSWTAAALATPDPGSDAATSEALSGTSGELTDDALQAEWNALGADERSEWGNDFTAYCFGRRNPDKVGLPAAG